MRPRLTARHLLLCLPLLAGLASGAQAQTLSISAPADVYEENFGKRDLRFPVTLSEAVSVPVTFSICFGSDGGTATIETFPSTTIPATKDFQPARLGAPVNGGCAGSTIPAGDTSNTDVGILVKGDTESEADETVVAFLQLTGTQTPVLAIPNKVTYTILDDDYKPEISIASMSNTSVTEGGGFLFKLTANRAPAHNMAVYLSLADAPDANFVDDEDVAHVVIFHAGQTGPWRIVGTRSDKADEPSGNVTMTVTDSLCNGYVVGTSGAVSCTDYTVSGSGVASVKVIDNDPTTVTLTTPDATATEGSSDTASLVLTLGRPLRAGESLAVPLGFSGGALGTDFTLSLSGSPAGVTLSGGTVTFTGSASGSATVATVLLSASQDGDITDETVTVSIPSSSTGTAPILTATGLDGGATGSRTGNGEIILNDAAPSKPTGFSATAGNAEVTLAWTDPNDNTITGWQYQETPYHTWKPIDGSTASTTSHTVTGLTNGTLYSFRIRAVAGTVHGAASEERTATPLAPVVQFSSASYNGSEAAGSRTVTVELSASPAFSAATNVSYAVSSTGTTTYGEDSNALGGPVSMTGGSGSIVVTILDDRIDEEAETIVLHLVAGSGYTVGARGSATITIADNDTAGVAISETNNSTSVSEAAGTDQTDTYTVVLESEPTAGVSITVTSGDTGAATVSPPTLRFTPDNWATSQMVTVTGVDDSVDQSGNRSVTIRHSATSDDGNYDNISIGDVTATVVDDDGAGVSISETSATVSEDGATTDTYRVVLVTLPSATVTVTVTAGAGVRVNQSGGTAGSSQTLTFTPGDWNIAQTVTVTGEDDAIDNPNDERTVTISHVAASTDPGYTIADAGRVTVTVTDDDTAGVTVESGGSMMVTEVDGPDHTDTYMVMLDSQPTHDVIITNITVTSGDAGAATVSPPTLTFTPDNWSTPQTVTVTGLDDEVDQSGSRSADVIHSATSEDGKYN
ncbi:MAG: hypothetical protein F4Z10_00145, partial [Synechococcus sp. SB0666_bin_14]|nr:hypothetical protein [Synechococcus sp. SB0666_bin_14]